MIDASNPRQPHEVAYWDNPGDNWSAYWYEQDGTSTSGPHNVFATHGVENPAASQGFQAFVANVPAQRTTLDHLNPQVQERFVAANVGKWSKQASAAPSESAAGSADSGTSGRVDPGKVSRRLAPER